MGEELMVLTTNNLPEQLNLIIKDLQQKNYKTDIYYTDETGFQKALLRYDQMLDYDKQLELRQDYRLAVR